MSFDTLDGEGTPFSNDPNLLLYIYPNTAEEIDTARNEIGDALVDFANQIYNNTNVDYFEVNLYEDTTNCNTDDRNKDDEDFYADTYFNNFRDWVDNNYGSYKGVHLGVTNHTQYAEAEITDKGSSGWNTCTKAFSGTYGNYDVTDEDMERIKNLAIQEPVHNLVVDKYNYVSDMTEGDEHDLGKITSSQSSTPMLTFYERDDTSPNRENDRSGKGDCSNYWTSWDETHTQTVTGCTEDSINYTSSAEY